MIPELSLKSGDSIPALGFGTWDIAEEDVEEPVRAALEAGYNHIDTAEGYRNESGIGRVIKDYDREELFITSKVLPANLNYENVIESAEQSLLRLGTSYLDLYLIHWPNPAISLRETLNAMAVLHEKGMVKNIGVSNFSFYQLMFAQKISRVPISVNQVEFHPYLYQKNLLDYCRENDIVLSASAPLARTEVFDDPVIKELSDKYNKTQAQIVLRWELEKGIAALPKSTNPEHIKSNLEVFDFELEENEHKIIDDLETEKRVYMINLDNETYGIRG
jgi:diketogulonate reductase-like aldo/keto reductase